MAFRLVWSPEALEDIKSIAEYIERDSLFYAKAVVEKIFKSMENLKEFPKMGRIVPELEKEDIRELIVYSYRLVYQIQENQILVIAVIHGKRKFDDAWGKYKTS